MRDNYNSVMLVKNKKMYIPKNYNKQNSLLIYFLGAWEMHLIKNDYVGFKNCTYKQITDKVLFDFD